MKTKLKIFKFITLLALFNSFYSCQEDEILIESDNKTFELKTSKVSINQVINEINTQEFKQKLQNKNFDSSISNALLRTNDSDIYFIKKEKDDELISYILHLNSYSQSKPYFLKLIITQNNNETERMGYIKYIPTSPIAILDMSTFTGEVQILDNNFEVNATSEYINGLKQENIQNSSTQNRIICTDEIIITEVKCSRDGNHGVGGICFEHTNPTPSDAYYVVSTFTRCTGDRTIPSQIIDDYGNPNSDGGTSSVNVGMALAHNFSLNLTSQQKLIYDLNQSIAVYLANNVIVVPDPSYNPILGGNPTMAIIDPQAEQFVLELMNFALLHYNTTDEIENTNDTISSILTDNENHLNNNSNIELPPSCESFNFTSNSNSNWQQAAVKNIKFRVVIVNPEGFYVNHDIRFSQAVLFGLPKNTITYGDISSGFAAELSATALQISMNETVALYGNQPVSEAVVRYYFIERLKYNYAIITNGGRVNFNIQNSPVTPTQYQTNLLGTGDCE